MSRQKKLWMYAACCLCEACRNWAGFDSVEIQWIMDALQSGCTRDYILYNECEGCEQE